MPESSQILSSLPEEYDWFKSAHCFIVLQTP